MSEPSIAYRLAEHIHDSFYSPKSNLSSDEIGQSGIRADVAEPYMTERLTAIGDRDGYIAYQHLSKSRKTGYFTLTTVFRHSSTQFARITPDAPIEAVPVLAETLFMQALNEIAETRQQS